MRQRVCTLTTRWCTQRKIGPVVMANEASWCAKEAADNSKKDDIVAMPTVVSNPPEARGVKAAPETDNESLPQNAGIVARKAIGRAGVGRSPLIQRKPHPDPGGPKREIGSDSITLRAPNEPEMERARPS